LTTQLNFWNPWPWPWTRPW